MMQCDNLACPADGAICAVSMGGAAWYCLLCGRYYEREDRMGNESDGVRELAKRILEGLVAVGEALVEAWDELTPEEKVRLYSTVKEEAKKIAREKR